LNHHEASLIHHDYLLGELPSEEAVEYEAHLASCVECRATLSKVKKFRQVVEGHGPELFENHPEPEELVALALGNEPIEMIRLATIRAHLSICPTCELEVKTAQGALRSRIPFRRILWGRFEQPSLRWAVAAGLAIVIATSGMILSGISNNSLKKESQFLTRGLIEAEQTVSLLSGQLEVLRTWSGHFSSLLLSAPFRGANTMRPSISLADDQPFLPVFVQLDSPSVFEGPDKLNVVLTNNMDNRVIWKISGSPESFWDKELQAFSFSVSTVNLETGDYHFEMSMNGEGEPIFQSEFHLSH
jgi:hypothetical protein